mmetsp:Transcript_3187/g.6778  ORF Transcript_3187/g.6778 Transcript_3187/m.6778 type:complete len:134 (-) Transcript_3187:39-440(-)
MESQIKEERERRASVLQADGEREAAVIRSAGNAAKTVLLAEGNKAAVSTKAKGEAEAKILVANAEAKCLDLLRQHIVAGSGGVRAVDYLVAMQYLGALGQLVPYGARRTEAIMVPSETLDVFGAIKQAVGKGR